jgi:hypothetical protein
MLFPTVMPILMVSMMRNALSQPFATRTIQKMAAVAQLALHQGQLPMAAHVHHRSLPATLQIGLLN